MLEKVRSTNPKYYSKDAAHPARCLLTVSLCTQIMAQIQRRFTDNRCCCNKNIADGVSSTIQGASAALEGGVNIIGAVLGM